MRILFLAPRLPLPADTGAKIRTLNILKQLTKNFTVKDIVKTIKRYIPSLKIKYVTSAIMNQLSYDVDDSKFRALGFAPHGKLHTSVGKTLKRLKGIQR